MKSTMYEIRVVGRLGPAARDALQDVTVLDEPNATVISGAMDQAMLLGLIDRIRALGLELQEVRRSQR